MFSAQPERPACTISSTSVIHQVCACGHATLVHSAWPVRCGLCAAIDQLCAELSTQISKQIWAHELENHPSQDDEEPR